MRNSKKKIAIIASSILFFIFMAFVLDLVLLNKIKNKTEDIEKSGSFEKHDVDLSPGVLTSHKALYKISLSSKAQFSQIQDINGEMLYELRQECGAWSTKHKFILNYEYADGPPLTITSDYTTYESFDGLSLNFSSIRKRDQDVFEQFRGYVSVDSEAGEAKVFYSAPEQKTEGLPRDIEFPMGHTLSVLKAAKAGEKFYTAPIFDGSDQEGALSVNAFIGKEVEVSKEQFQGNDGIDGGLLQAPARSVRLAFFPVEVNAAETADYEMDIVFHDNGVVSNIEVEYEEFAVDQKLVALEPLSPESCD